MKDAPVVLEYLELSRAMLARMAPSSPYLYSGEADFLLRHGQVFPVRAMPPDVPMGLPRRCFSNAAELALRERDRFLYCEGYALAVIPTAHAWCLDRDGFVVDPTWPAGEQYWGVAFRADYLYRTLLQNRQTGLLMNYAGGWPLFTGEHTLEEALEDVNAWLAHLPSAEAALPSLLDPRL